MDNKLLESAFSNLSTPLIADACVRLQVPLRIAPSGIRPLVPDTRVAGRALPAHHRGSVDVFLEVLRKALPGDVLVVDNDGRSDESCVGDLTVMEARAWGVAGLVVRGYHRDTKELVRLGFPVFELSGRIERVLVASIRGFPRIFFQLNGTVSLLTVMMWFLRMKMAYFSCHRPQSKKCWKLGKSIWKVERQQAEAIQDGKSLSEQLDLDGYLAKRLRFFLYSP